METAIANNLYSSVASTPVQSRELPLSEDTRANWYQSKWMTVGWHIIAWVVLYSLPYLLRLVYDENRAKDPDSTGFFYLTILTGLLWTSTFYLNAYVLIPKLVYKKKYLLFGLLIIVIYPVIIRIHGAMFNSLIHHHEFSYFFSALFNAPAFLLVLAASTVYQLAKDKIENTRLAQQRQQENLRTELSFLRSQISPHFIFNVLNNIVALARLKSDQLEPTVIKLSSLMQYMLYDTNQETVLLKTETEYLEAYIDLQRQRFGGNVRINVNINTADDFYEIEPMLLIPFVENAFKHGVGLIENPEINIDLETKDNMLFFKVRNKYNSSVPEVKDKASGIGLHNVRRRLNLLYKDQHKIRINNSFVNHDSWFEVTLQLNLH